MVRAPDQWVRKRGSAACKANGSPGSACQTLRVAGRILIVEDEPNIGALVRDYLRREGHEVAWVRSGEEALAEVARTEIGLMVLDVGLPGIDGFEVCRRVAGQVPVVMLTARDEEPDRVAGLELGADDYLAKPFSPRELAARVRAVLRRGPTADGAGSDVLALGPVRLWPGAREVSVEGRAVELTQREFDLLAYLLARPGRVVSKAALLADVWGFASPGETRTVEVHVAQVRKKLGRLGLIRTVRGVGYKAVAP